MPKNSLFPIFLKMEDKHTLIVGGGNVALEKLRAIYDNSPRAKITLVAPKIKEETLSLLLRFPSRAYRRGDYDKSDLQGKRFVIGATDDKALHAQIKRDAEEQGILVNIADTPDLCDFYLSSIVQKGNIKIAISSGGLSPTIAKRIKETLQTYLPEEIDELAENLHAIRNRLKGDFSYKVKELNRITKPLVEEKKSAPLKWICARIFSKFRGNK